MPQKNTTAVLLFTNNVTFVLLFINNAMVALLLVNSATDRRKCTSAYMLLFSKHATTGYNNDTL